MSGRSAEGMWGPGELRQRSLKLLLACKNAGLALLSYQKASRGSEREYPDLLTWQLIFMCIFKIHIVKQSTVSGKIQPVGC